MDEFTPGNKTIYVVFDEESEFSGPRRQKLSPDQVVYKKRTQKKLSKNILLMNLEFIPQVGLMGAV